MHVTLVTSYVEFKKLAPDAIEDHLFATVEDGQNIYVLVNDEWDDTGCSAFIQCLSHEMNHAAMCILGLSGIAFDYDNQEALCYLQDFLLRKSLDGIASNRKRNGVIISEPRKI